MPPVRRALRARILNNLHRGATGALAPPAPTHPPLHAPPNLSILPVPSQLPPPSLIDHDLPCRRCGYNLRGLEQTGLCPECGSPARLSLIGDFLAASDPAHVSRLFRGAVLVEVSFYLHVLLSCIASPIAVAVALPASAAGMSGTVISITHALLTLASLTGWWLVATPDPGRAAISRGESLRSALRICLIVSAVATVTAAVGTTAGSLTADPALSSLLLRGGAILGVLTWIVQYFISTAYVRELALRIPSPQLATTARTNLRLPLWIFGLGTPVAIATAIIGNALAAFFLITMLALALMGSAALLWFVWYCSMISGLRDRLESVRALMPQVVED